MFEVNQWEFEEVKLKNWDYILFIDSLEFDKK